MKILHTGDIHLKGYEDERWNALKELIQLGKQQNIDVFVIAGDFFDKDIDATLLHDKINNVFKETGFKTVIIPGNHDANSYDEGLFFGQDTIIIRDINEPFIMDNVYFWGLPFEDLKEIGVIGKLNQIKPRLSDENINILLYHGQLTDKTFSRDDFGEEKYRYMPIKSEFFANYNFKFILAGHLHKNYKPYKLSNGCIFVYPGSPISIKKSEIGIRKVNIFETENVPQPYELSTLHFLFKEIRINPDETTSVLEKIKEYINGIHPSASIILFIKGFINSTQIQMTEVELNEKINEIISDKKIELIFEVSDISKILNNNLYKKFKEKLEKLEDSNEMKAKINNVVLKAMMQVDL